MYFPVLLWSLVIFASFWGYGEALRRALKRPEFDDIGWGLTAAWGMAVTLAIGGFLMMLSLAKAPILTGVVLLGAAFALYFVSENLTKWTAPPLSPKKSKSKNPKKLSSGDAFPAPRPVSENYLVVVAKILVWTLAALAFASSIAWPHHIDPNDDLVSYLMLPQKILGSGTLLEPFNFQRAGSYGGHHLLQALAMIMGGELNGHIPDMGWARLLLFGMVFQIIRSACGGLNLLGAVVLIVVILMPVPRISTASSMTSATMLLALFQTMHLTMNRIKVRTALVQSIPAALVLMAAGSLRPMALVAGGLFVILAMLRQSFLRNWDRAAYAFLSGALAGLLLIPYAITLWQSNGTLLNPPFLGNVNPLFVDMSTRRGIFEDLLQAVKFFANWNVWPLVFATIPLLFLKRTRVGIEVFFAVLLSSFLIAESCAVVIPSEVYRYTFPLLFAAACLSLALLAGSAIRPTSLAGISLIALLILLVLPNAGMGAVMLKETLFSLPNQWNRNVGFFQPGMRSALLELQRAVPPGEKILSVVDAPYYFDFARNPIDTINSIGGAAPGGGLPLEKGGDALKAYLLNHGYRYVIAVDFNSAVLLYNRKHWLNHKRPEWYWQEVWGRYALNFMKNMESIRDSNRILMKKENMYLIDLK